MRASTTRSFFLHGGKRALGGIYGSRLCFLYFVRFVARFRYRHEKTLESVMLLFDTGSGYGFHSDLI